jgi:RNA polymerase sigma factor (sigma-70 family)
MDEVRQLVTKLGAQISGMFETSEVTPYRGIQAGLKPLTVTRLASLLSHASETLADLPGASDHQFLVDLEHFGAVAPPAAASRADHIDWALSVLEMIRVRVLSKGFDFDRRNGFLTPMPAASASDADLETISADAVFDVCGEFVVAGMVDAYVLSLQGAPPRVFHRRARHALEIILEAAHRNELTAGPLRLEGPIDQLVGAMEAVDVRANTALYGVAGTRLRQALRTRHGGEFIDAALDEELPGAVESARSHFGEHSEARPRSLGEIRRDLGQLRSAAVQEVIKTQAVDLDKHGLTWTHDIDILASSAGEIGSDPEADTLARFELREALARLAQLTGRERQVVDAMLFGQLSRAEAAEEIGISRNAVSVHLSHALRKLRPEAALSSS